MKLKFSLFVTIQFFLATLICMLLYKGGTRYNPDLTHYSFIKNFFSDMGRTQDFRGNSNLLVMVIFAYSLSMMGIGIIVFYFQFIKILAVNKILEISILILAVLSGIGFIGVAATPWNIYRPEHMFFVKKMFFFFWIITLLSSVAIKQSKNYATKYATWFVVFNILLAAYLIMINFGPKPHESEMALIIQVIAQKIIIYFSLVCVLVQIVGAMKYEKQLRR